MQRPQWIDDHIALYRTDPEKALWWDSALGGSSGMLKTLLLTTKGRKSGKEIPTPLIFGEANGAFVVVASKGGAPTHPLWYLNLKADPNAEIQVGRDHHSVKARDAQGDERKQLWVQLAKLYPPYDDYQVRAGDREIPVVVLDPVRGA
jgi:deazaflavin-dependent oxidoreductase (nitroreductase family)